MINSRATQKDCAPQILATAQLAPPLLAASGHIGDDDEDEDGDDDEDGDINIMTKCVCLSQKSSLSTSELSAGGAK